MTDSTPFTASATAAAVVDRDGRVPDSVENLPGLRVGTPMEEVVLVTALGRVAWSFLALEETVIAILDEAGPRRGVDPRSIEAGGRERALQKVHRDLGYRSVAGHVLAELENAIGVFSAARAEHRRALGMVAAFTSPAAADVRRLMRVDPAEGRPDATDVARELRDIAASMEHALEPLGRARRLLRGVR